MKEELTKEFQSLIDKSLMMFDNDKVRAYEALLKILMNQYVEIPLDYYQPAKVVEGNIAWLTKHLRFEIQTDIAKLEALDTAEENPE